jgi:nucleotide-binding universal stress UspA family protein
MEQNPQPPTPSSTTDAALGAVPTAPPGGDAGSRPRIVVGVDGSPSSQHALRWAARLADALGLSLEAVTSWHYPQTYGWSLAYADDWQPSEDARRVQETAVGEVFGDARPSDLVTEVVEGPAARVLLDAARGAAMLVLGSRGHGGFAGLLLGSVSSACAEHADCPVLVVHGDAVADVPSPRASGDAQARPAADVAAGTGART